MTMSSTQTYNAGDVLTADSLTRHVTEATPTALSAAMSAAGFDITALDELAFTDAVAGATVGGRIRRNGVNLEWHNGTASGRLFFAGGVDVPVADGGTGTSSLTDGGILLGSGTGAITPMAVLADGAIVVGDGATDPVALSAFTSSTGTLKHEQGGVEADISAVTTGDLIVGSGAGAMALNAAMSQAQAEAGVDTTVRGVTAQRIKQAIDALVTASPSLQSVQVFTATDTWNRPAGITIVVIEVVGGGGGGGSSGGAANAGGGGGGGGGYSAARLDVSAIASSTVTIGAAGSAGSTSAGGTGGTSSWADGTNTVSATGGAGGARGGPNVGGAGGSGSGGAVNSAGGGGGSSSGAEALAGAGGSSRWGGGARGNAGNTVGAAGGNYGGGGAGGATVDGTERNGGAGAAGLVVVWEHGT